MGDTIPFARTQTNYFGEPLVGVGEDSKDLSFPDMKKLSAAYGYPYVSVCHNGEISRALTEALSVNGPVICEVFVSRDQNFEPKSAAKRLPDGHTGVSSARGCVTISFRGRDGPEYVD